ncbi:MAG: TnpV protein [Oscillospiraceae bacterium]|nr:TnpV protein [Oscillospiraceae bacterium]
MKSLFEELGGTYHREGDYLIPDLIAPGAPHVGIWGMRRRDYLLKNREPIYTSLLLSGKLNAHLEEIDRSASAMFELLIKQYAAREGVTEQLKATDQMEWVRRMNSIRDRVTEVVNHELIYA